MKTGKCPWSDLNSICARKDLSHVRRSGASSDLFSLISDSVQIKSLPTLYFFVLRNVLPLAASRSGVFASGLSLFAYSSLQGRPTRSLLSLASFIYQSKPSMSAGSTETALSSLSAATFLLFLLRRSRRSAKWRLGLII